MKNTFLLLIFVAFGYLSRSQTITIPDVHFANWLDANLPGVISGNQLDTSNLQVKTLVSMDISNDTIKDLEGIQYFIALRVLDCRGNRIDTLPALPDSLKVLNCSGNRLTLITEIPDSVTFFDCASNQLDTLPMLSNILVYFDCRSNYLTSLLSLPATLTYFDCSSNRLSRLPALPPLIPVLNCYENRLDSLPLLPDSLISVNCRNNLLTALPPLPESLSILDCNSNLISSLPVLPDSLRDLECHINQLTSLPVLPNYLTLLSCGLNQISILPALPSTLITLKCYANSLSNLPPLPSSLIYLDCSYNSLLMLPSLPASLNYLNCESNQLPILPSLPGMITNLVCSRNFLSNLPFLPGSLNNLICSYNPLINLPSLPISLQSLDCSNATLDSLPAIPAYLSQLNCSFNSLTVLPASVNNVRNLICNNNLLTDLPVLSSNLYGLGCANNNIHCFNEFPGSLQWIDINSNPFVCLPNYLAVMSSQLLALPLCLAGDTLNNPHGCAGAEGIVGFTYTDNNSSCGKDSLDGNLKNIPLSLRDATGQLISLRYTASNGVYHFPETAGIYEVRVDTTGMPISPQCTNPGTDSIVALTVTDPLVANVNFGFNCKPGYDIGVRSVVPVGLVFPGETHLLKIDAGDMTQWYNLACASGLSGQVDISINGPVTFSGIASGALAPVVSGNTFSYPVADFGSIINSQAFGMNLIVDPSAGEGDLICVHINASPSAGDNDTSNNSFDFCYKVVNSYDPNIKETYPEKLPLNYSEWLTYTIHFQNTGSAPAINIVLKDTLDSQLDLTTFQPIAYSHDNQVTLDGNALMIKFPDIYLSDSTSNADSSKGYFQYRIKTLSWGLCGAEIHNTASIYFDFNAPVVTNTTVNAYPTIPEPLILSDTTLCYGSSLTLNAVSEGNIVNWYNSDNVFLNSGNLFNIQNLHVTTSLNVEALSPEGCSSALQNVDIAVLPPVVSPLLSINDTVCYRDTLLLSALTVSGWDYHWSGPSGFTSSLEDPQINSLSANNSGDYHLYVSKGQCVSDTAEVYLLVDSEPYIHVTNNPYICLGDSVELFCQGNLRDIAWNTGQSTGVINVSPSETKLYIVNGKNSCGVAGQNILVTVYTPPVAVALNATLIAGESTTLHAEGGSLYSWSPSNGLSCTDCPEPFVNIMESQSYSVIVTDDHGCKDTTEMSVSVIEEKNTVYIPNSFTPDSDGLNDEFGIYGTNIKNLRMMIYEKSGEVMFESFGKESRWNGTVKGNEISSGLYIYIIRVAFEDGTEKNLKGYVSLIK